MHAACVHGIFLPDANEPVRVRPPDVRVRLFVYAVSFASVCPSFGV